MEELTLPAEASRFVNEIALAKLENKNLPTTTVAQLFPGPEWSQVRSDLESYSIAKIKDGFLAVDRNDEGVVFALAAAIPRKPGRAERFLRNIADFTDESTPREQKIPLLWNVYYREGICNNAVNKGCALVATEGSFKVRYVRGQRGKGGNKKAEELKVLLKFWAENVNNRPPEAVLTGARGIKTFILQGSRQAMVEGDHVARMHWVNVKVPLLKNKSFSLPMNLQSISAANIEIPEALAGVSMEIMYWKPPMSLISQLQNPTDTNVGKKLKQMIPSEVRNALIKDKKWLMDESLLVHVKHRGTDTRVYGESFLEPALADIAYKRALTALDLVTIENLMNRLLIIKIGSDDPNSVYHRAEVTQHRVNLMQQMLQSLGPAGTVVWAGPDISVEEAGAHGNILETDERFRQARAWIREDLGMPSSLLTGEGTDGKAAGISALAGVVAQLRELQDQYGTILTGIGERIALENGFEDVNVVWQFRRNLLVDKTENATVMFGGYDRGVVGTEIMVEELGLDPEAVEQGQADDVAKGYKTEVFGPPKHVQTTNPGGNGGESGGRPTNKERPGTRDPRKNRETKEPDSRK